MGSEEYSLKFTPKAVEDLDEIYGYIANNLFAPEAAENLMDKIETSIMRLKAFPYSCSFVLDEPLKKRGYRKLIVDNYIVFYMVNEQERQVVIMRILYGASNYQTIL
ncbi:MAG TPA: type II toxin-antitoxin system RelE/ParE family toxin [Syntrophomonadaceae bacterium]|nr:type II toxin-antitoxin system RelE/ParE family toxin [Syntrophomonadaceae bacterium]